MSKIWRKGHGKVRDLTKSQKVKQRQGIVWVGKIAQLELEIAEPNRCLVGPGRKW